MWPFDTFVDTSHVGSSRVERNLHAKQKKPDYTEHVRNYRREYWIDVPVLTKRCKEPHEMTASEAYNTRGYVMLRFDQMTHEDLWNPSVFPIYDKMTAEDIGI